MKYLMNTHRYTRTIAQRVIGNAMMLIVIVALCGIQGAVRGRM